MANLRKLTLSVDERVIRRAHRYSRRHNTSISKLVTSFLSQLGSDEEGLKRFSPTVERLRGILPPETSVTQYRDHLERKHRG
jgi:hypothetical protein